jgi:hypothetical protein
MNSLLTWHEISIMKWYNKRMACHTEHNESYMAYREISNQFATQKALDRGLLKLLFRFSIHGI